MATNNQESSPRGRRRLVAYAINLALVVASIGVAIVLAELALRVAGVGSDQFLRPDLVLGVRYIPSKSGLNQDTCYSARVSTNSHGWRNREVSVVKPDGVFRVLVLGDSYMAGLQVDDHQTFASELEGLLGRENLPRRVEVINLGVPSYGTDQEYLALREFGLAYKPDLVLLAFYGQNDVSDNYRLLISSKSDYPKPFFDVEHDELVQLPFAGWMPWPIRIGRRIAAHSRLYLLVRDTLIQYPTTLRMLHSLGIVGIVPQEDDPTAKAAAPWPWPNRWRRQVGVYERNDQWAPRLHAWEITEGLLHRTRKAAEAGGAAFLLVELSSPISVMPKSMLDDLVLHGGAGAVDRDLPSRRISDIAQRKDIRFVSLVPGFRERIGDSPSELGRYYLRCDGHWTPAGHKLAAELVAPAVAEQLRRAAK